jgi:hypothetical protein
MGSKKNNTKLSDLNFGQNLQGIHDKNLSKFQGGKTKNEVDFPSNSNNNVRWNGCGDFVPL